MRSPAPTVRLRLTVLYGLVFLVTGAVLLTIGYLLVRHNIGGVHIRAQLDRLLPLPPERPRVGIAGARFALARQLHDQLVSAALHRLVVEYALALGAMTLISVGAGWLLAGRALRPLRDITATARRVSGENLGERIDLVGPADELKELADTFDGMLERLDAAFASQRHFVANASHELRTPLAIMRTEIDVALAERSAGAEELRAMGEALRETIDRCERLIESLLMLARSEGASGSEEAVDLASLAGDCVTDLHRFAVDADVAIETELEPAFTRGEPHLLERAIANLIDNGIRHNVPGGHLRVGSGSENGSSWISVSNGGPVIDSEQARALSEPFQRLDRRRGGFGLGLSIVRSVAEVHGGSSEIVAPESGGLEVRLKFPRDDARAGVDAPESATTLTKS
jgi:signal transduction histidine kinase